MIGRSRATAHHILKTVANKLDDNHRLDINQPTDTLIPGADCFFLEVSPHHYQDYVGFARWYYRNRHFPLYQLVWRSNDRLYPWSPEASGPFKEWQPVLGEALKDI